MSKRLVLALICMVLGVLGLSGCDACDMIAPELVSPEFFAILSGPLEWSYDDSCTPDNFEVELSRDSFFHTLYDIEIVSGTSTTLTPSGLDPGEYFWRVRAEDDGAYGPYSPVHRSFFTGPICDEAHLVPPELVYPPYGGIYDDDYDSVEWAWPVAGCIPESYRVEVSQYLDFHDSPANEGIIGPTTRWGFGDSPPDATQYFWRITPYIDGILGPASEIGMFYTGPVCSGGSLVEAVPLIPPTGDTVLTGNPELTWSYPDSSCIPEGYHLRIYHGWDWDHPVLEVDSPDAFSFSFQAEVPLPDCSDYYWQVSMISEGVEGPLNIGQRFIVDSGSCDCGLGSIPIPVLERPTPYEIYPDTNIHSHWHSPGGCFPSGASYKIASDPDFVDTSRDVMMSRRFPNAYDPPGLEPATQYWWKVAFFEDDGSGEPVIGEYSERQSFFTGPECGSAAELGEPILIDPADGAVVDTTVPIMHYLSGASCLPDEYMVNLHMVPDLSDPNLMGHVPLPATYVSPDTHLLNCEEYFWMVTAVKDGVEGPHSTINSFFVNEGGLCLSRGTPGTAKSNNFCREGTFAEYFEPLWTFNEGDNVMAVAQNPLGTYLKFIVMDQKSMEPMLPETFCWSYSGNFEPDRPGAFDQLPVENPPDPPEEEPEPAPNLICQISLGSNDCAKTGGIYDTNKNVCQCP